MSEREPLSSTSAIVTSARAKGLGGSKRSKVVRGVEVRGGGELADGEVPDGTIAIPCAW